MALGSRAKAPKRGMITRLNMAEISRAEVVPHPTLLASLPRDPRLLGLAHFLAVPAGALSSISSMLHRSIRPEGSTTTEHPTGRNYFPHPQRHALDG